MERRFWRIGTQVSRRPALFMSGLLLLMPFSFQANASGMCDLFSESGVSASILSISMLAFVLTLLGAALIMSILIFVFSAKLRSANRELRERNKQIENINSDLQKANKDLSIQKEAITREYTYSEMFYRMLIQSADDGISFYDRDWNLKYANAAFYSMIGFDKEKYDRINAGEIIHSEDIDYEKNRTAALQLKGVFETELRLKHKDGHYVNLSTRSVTVKNENNEIIGALTISRDITSLEKSS